MTSSSIARFFRLVLIILSPILLLGCEQKITTQKDLGTLPTGEYHFTGVTSYTISGDETSSPFSGTLKTAPGNSEDSFYFVENAPGYQLKYQTHWSGSAFTVEPCMDGNTHQNVVYYAKQSGSGSGSPWRIELDRYVSTTSQVVINSLGEQTTYTLPMRKHVRIIATK